MDEGGRMKDESATDRIYGINKIAEKVSFRLLSL